MTRQRFCAICAKEFDVTNTTGFVLICKECDIDPKKKVDINEFLKKYPFAKGAE